ncbi:VOC family protein [Brevibacterium sp. UCMA 11754]|uniref:VOC family protein n=1 Tax=Brevibacterium sp. UCMA 11754 TaxID=2749198 RepID=UPI001F454C0C|nr:VOC family protein [Brevibacterium sp. UCMA 11754]MCF2571983.1 VOC family protein [Brevibacterium sp. UCMA 11754]
MASLSSLSITFDCKDVEAQSVFWAELLKAELDDGANEFVASIGGVHSGESTTPGMLFLKVEERGEGKNPLHIDLDDPNYPADVDRAVALGAEKVESFAEFGIEWTTLKDPEGNVFDIGRKTPNEQGEI